MALSWAWLSLTFAASFPSERVACSDASFFSAVRWAMTEEGVMG
jgi:hypothetical protein